MNGLYCLKVIEQEGSLVSGTSELRSHLENLQSNKKSQTLYGSIIFGVISNNYGKVLSTIL